MGVYGVRGWVRVASHMDPREALLGCAPWLLRRRGDPPGRWRHRVRPLEGRAHGKGLVARLEGWEDRDQARELVGLEVWVPRDRLPPTGPREHYWADLEGLEVLNREGVRLGRVARLLETGAHDVLVVRGERERLIPYVWDRYVLEVDLDAGRLMVDWHPED
ncbi:MAG: 16S rRNA processing protein RimM [Gammaproteobacteria bacterium]|nr:MAG: 16S rRNA processing protein RimM [Gammaproteobacteria bacterium]